MILPSKFIQCAAVAVFGMWLPAVRATAQTQSCSSTSIINIGIPNADGDKIQGSAMFGQTFVSPVSNCLAQVTLLACKSGGANGTVAPVQPLVVELRDTLSGSPLATANIAPGDVSTFCAKESETPQFSAINAVFSSQASLKEGQGYALVFYQSNSGGSGNQYYKLGLQKPGTYAGGQFCKMSGTTWACQEANGERDTSLSICTAACCAGCTYTQGYWKNHTEWPVSTLTLGQVQYSEDQLIEILETAVSGNGLISLAHQLIAAKLNQANGACVPKDVLSAIAQADELIGSRVVLIDSLPPADTSALVKTLDEYNQGNSDVPHCGEGSSH
jgi:hypothetical protein